MKQISLGFIKKTLFLKIMSIENLQIQLNSGAWAIPEKKELAAASKISKTRSNSRKKTGV